jgi:hypothetical protein
LFLTNREFYPRIVGIQPPRLIAGADRWPDVRFTPKADKQRIISASPLCANSRHMRRSKDARYSITSSARASNVRWPAMLAALAIASAYRIKA